MPTLTLAHGIFHFSMLKKYIIIEASHKIDFSEVKIQYDMFYIEKPVKILNTNGKGIKDKYHPYGKGSLEESHSRRSHMGC